MTVEAKPVAWRYRPAKENVWQYSEGEYPNQISGWINEPLYSGADYLSALHSPAHSGEQEFRPCVIHYEDGDYSQMVIEDCPTVTGHPPVAVEALYDLNDRERIVGFQWYGRRPAPAHSGEAEAWRYDIQYGPDGEANYAWVYRGKEMVATVKTHHAIAIVNAMNGTPAHRGEREELDIDSLAAEFMDGFTNGNGVWAEMPDYHKGMYREGVKCLLAALEAKQP